MPYATSTTSREQILRRLTAVVLTVLASSIALPAQEPVDSAVAPTPIDLNDPLPYAQSPIRYDDDVTTDRLAEWQKGLDETSTPHTFDEHTGYLKSLLEELSVPVDSQVLVFSKTAVNTRHIGPQTPRAIYFNDEVYVAWVPAAKTLELAAVDPRKGFLFYTLLQEPGGSPRLHRERNCLTCHINSATLNVPGVMLRSMSVDDKGKPYEGFSRITHDSPFEKRWGGWYVTNAPDRLMHLGNLIGKDDFRRQRSEPGLRGSQLDLAAFCDLSRYPLATSDVVPMLVFNHQAHGQNLILRAGYEARLNVRSTVEDELFRYLLFLDEPALPSPVTGSDKYRQWFETLGVRDETGRSLREFDLTTRLFRFRVSYLIHSRLFQELPADVKQRIYARIRQALAGKEPTVPESWHTTEDRAALLSLMTATVWND